MEILEWVIGEKEGTKMAKLFTKFELPDGKFDMDWLVLRMYNGQPVDIWIGIFDHTLKAVRGNRIKDETEYVRPIQWIHENQDWAIDKLHMVNKADLADGLLCNHEVALWLRDHNEI